MIEGTVHKDDVVPMAQTIDIVLQGSCLSKNETGAWQDFWRRNNQVCQRRKETP